MSEPSPLGALAARAASLFARRFALYAGFSLLAFGVESAAYFSHVFPKDAAIDVTEAILLPIVALVAYVFTAFDASSDHAAASPWARVVERAWAVIVIDFIPVGISLPAVAASDPSAAFFLGYLSFGVALLLLFADVHAAVEPEVSSLTLVPIAIRRSISLIFRPYTIVPVIVLIVVQLALELLGASIFGGLAAARVPDADFWGRVPFDALVTAPYAVLATVFYFDCVAREAVATNQRG